MTPRITDEQMCQIREAIDLASDLGRHVKLTKVGVDHTGSCPFCKADAPAFHVHPPKQIYYCYACHEKGDVFSLYMKSNGTGFHETAAWLAETRGISLAPDVKSVPDFEPKKMPICTFISALHAVREANRLAYELPSGKGVNARITRMIIDSTDRLMCEIDRALEHAA